MATHDLPVNKNGRIYPADVLRKMVEDAKPRIEAGSMFGQLESPADGKTRIRDASHVVRDVKVDRLGRVIGTVEFLDTPNGRVAEEMVKAGQMFGSLRGVGTVDENGVVIDMKPLSFDVTMFAPEFEPSAVDQLADLAREDED